MGDVVDGEKANINDIFSLRKPRDVKAGLSSGLKSMGKGIVGGAVGLFAAPVVGASQEGFTGFAKGVATGKLHSKDIMQASCLHNLMQQLPMYLDLHANSRLTVTVIMHSGVAGAVILPVTGVSVGLVQVARGIINQPEAISESSRGKVWDQVVYHLLHFGLPMISCSAPCVCCS